MILLPEIPEDKVLIEALAKEFKKSINSIFDDLLNVDNFVEKFGHKVMKIENDYLIKYKTI